MPNKLCVFPFWYNGTRYDECTSIDNDGVSWCSTEVDANDLHIVGQTGSCGPYCHVKEEGMYQ